MIARETRWAALIVLAFGAVILGILWPLLWETVYGHLESERQVRDLVGALRLGATREAVDRTLSASRYGKLIVRDRGVSEWSIGTPGTLGATDWTIRLRFGDAGLACVTVGTADDWSRPPAGAPATPCAR